MPAFERLSEIAQRLGRFLDLPENALCVLENLRDIF
jgi:hypothetical protein